MIETGWHHDWLDKIRPSTNWREEYQAKMTTPEEAAKRVKSGDRVACPTGRDPLALGLALAARGDELSEVRLFLGTPTHDFAWYDPAWQDFFHLCIGYTFPRGVAADCLAQRRVDVFTGGLFIFDDLPDAWDVDVLLVEVSAPDDNGFCSFGASVYDKRHWVAKAKLVLAEVNDRLIKTCGDNRVHISQIDCFVLHPHTNRKPGEVTLAGQSVPEVKAEQKQISKHVSSLIRDGDTVQIGQGGTSESLVRCDLFDSKNDIGWHSEVTPGGIIKLVRRGIITGRYKTRDQGIAVATAIGGGTVEEMHFVHLNPLFELRDIVYTHDPRIISSLDNMVSINNALEVDLTGQINAESRGAQMFSGPGGLLPFTIGARLSRNGRSIIVFPATAKGETVSRIVPILNSKVTVPHTLADFVVTEYGIARLRGRTIRERVEGLISIAHPDFRDDLRKTSQGLYWP